MNLLDRKLAHDIANNAVEAGAKELSVEFTKTRVVFTDNGPGFSEDILKKLKEGAEVTSKENGHGIGTSSIREFCESNNFSLEFTNSVTKTGAKIILAKKSR